MNIKSIAVASILSLGIAGGALAAGLVLGRLHRTGPILWSIPFPTANALGQYGMLAFLAYAGSTSGSKAANTTPPRTATHSQLDLDRASSPSTPRASSSSTSRVPLGPPSRRPWRACASSWPRARSIRAARSCAS